MWATVGLFPLFTHLTIPVELLSCSRRVHGLHGDIRASSRRMGQPPLGEVMEEHIVRERTGCAKALSLKWK